MNNITKIIMENMNMQNQIIELQKKIKQNNEKIIIIAKEATAHINTVLKIDPNEPPPTFSDKMKIFRKLQKVCEERSELRDNLLYMNDLIEKFYTRCGNSMINENLFDRLDDEDYESDSYDTEEEEEEPKPPPYTPCEKPIGKIHVFDSDDEDEDECMFLDSDDEEEEEENENEIINAFKNKLSKALDKVIIKPTNLSDCTTKDEMRNLIQKQMNQAKKGGWNYNDGITMDGFGLTFN